MNPYSHPVLSFPLAFQKFYPDTYFKHVAHELKAMQHDHSLFPPNREVTELTKYLKYKSRGGNHLFFLTATYNTCFRANPSLLSPSAKFGHFYIEVLKQTIHPYRYNKPKFRLLQPIMLVFADGPGSKRKHYNTPIRDNTFDLHHHALVSVSDFIADKFYNLSSDKSLRNNLVANCPQIKTIDLQPIYPASSSIERVTSYAVGNDNFILNNDKNEQMLVFPISSSEFKTSL